MVIRNLHIKRNINSQIGDPIIMTKQYRSNHIDMSIRLKLAIQMINNKCLWEMITKLANEDFRDYCGHIITNSRDGYILVKHDPII